MLPSSTVQEALEITLQKIGRNVVNFQKMEAMLKFILTFARFSIPISRAGEYFKEQAASIERESMGALVSKAAKVLHAESKETDSPVDLSEIWLTHSFTFEGGDPHEWRRLMKAVVEERNELIHQMLIKFDPTSLDSCISLAKKLDDQRSRILSAYEHLESIVKAMRETHRELAERADVIAEQDYPSK